MSRLRVRRFRTATDPFPEGRTAGSSDVGLAFSGGGTRSAALTTGYLRGLHALGIADRVSHIGATSGGSWTSVPYTFLPERFSDADFLGTLEIAPASTLDARRIETVQPRDGIQIANLSQADILLRGLGRLFVNLIMRLFDLRIPILGVELGPNDPDETFGDLIAAALLRSVGLDDDRYAAVSRAQRATIVDRNARRLGPDRLDNRDFYVARNGRPFLIVNGVMNALFRESLAENGASFDIPKVALFDWYHFEMTPMYSGVPRHDTPSQFSVVVDIGDDDSAGVSFDLSFDVRFNVGGGFVENHGIDTWQPLPTFEPDILTVEPGKKSHRFGPKDMMAVSGAAPAYIVQAVSGTLGPVVPGRSLFDVFPRLRTWPPEYTVKPVTFERGYGDGGYVDPYGIVPLLRRGVQKIVVFINTDTALSAATSGANDPAATTFGIDGGLPVFFGRVSAYDPFDRDRRDTVAEPVRALKERGQLFTSDGWERTVRGLQATKAAGGPTQHRDTYDVVDNTFFGIEGGRRVDVLWIYNDVCTAFEAELPLETRNRIARHRASKIGRLATFPLVRTFFSSGIFPEGFDVETSWPTFDEADLRELLREMERRADEGLDDTLIDLYPEQAILLSHQAAWTMERLQGPLEAIFGPFVGTRVSLRTCLEEAEATPGDSMRTASLKHAPGGSLRDLARTVLA